jgi:hypothetical protein
MSSVTVIDEGPRRSATTFGLTPAYSTTGRFVSTIAA